MIKWSVFGFAVLLLSVINGFAHTQDVQIKKLRIGDVAPAWNGLLGVDDNKHSLADLRGKELVVVIFTCNDCKAANAYEQRLIRFATPYAAADSKVAVVAISLYNHGERDSLEAMKVRARVKGYKFSYVIDPTQKLGLDFGATRTPQVFVLDKNRKIAYNWPFDDAVDPRKVQRSYVELALDALLNGKQPAIREVEMRFGCPIRYKQAEPDAK